ncbi:MAG: ATP synthase F1 subunit gamma [Blautia sp.]|jgi:F-type H+-transporting ATPase subunit gamma
MANAREIQVRMKSIKDTMKITNAMYMISSSKMKRAKKILEDTEPYFYSIQSTISRILRHVPDMEHIYFDERLQIPEEERKIGYIVVTADKGLAGGYNHSVMKMAEEELRKPGYKKLFVLGMLGRQYFSKKQVNLDTSFRYTVQHPTIHRARLISREMLKEFQDGELDEIYIIYTQMINAVQTEATMAQLLPLKKGNFSTVDIPLDVHREEILLAPSGEELMDSIVPNYLVGLIYGCLVESYASEHNSRMLAMQASTKSAGEMLKSLSIEYNRARQAAITQEITEVISGARAQKGSD